MLLLPLLLLRRLNIISVIPFDVDWMDIYVVVWYVVVMPIFTRIVRIKNVVYGINAIIKYRYLYIPSRICWHHTVAMSSPTKILYYNKMAKHWAHS